mmetsp:Transcript_17567/g.36777  ORF Transcript_17567/g.36777 Transcript_17567/m.36777 type:complete len:224 (-) Transcript_17567:360-1031(-)
MASLTLPSMDPVMAAICSKVLIPIPCSRSWINGPMPFTTVRSSGSAARPITFQSILLTAARALVEVGKCGPCGASFEPTTGQFRLICSRRRFPATWTSSLVCPIHPREPVLNSYGEHSTAKVWASASRRNWSKLSPQSPPLLPSTLTFSVGPEHCNDRELPGRRGTRVRPPALLQPNPLPRALGWQSSSKVRGSASVKNSAFVISASWSENRVCLARFAGRSD